MLNQTTSIRRKIREAKTSLQIKSRFLNEQFEELSDELYKNNILEKSKRILDSISLTTRLIADGLFFEALKELKKSQEILKGFDADIVNTKVIQQLISRFEEIKMDISHLCSNYLMGYIYNYGVEFENVLEATLINISSTLSSDLGGLLGIDQKNEFMIRLQQYLTLPQCSETFTKGILSYNDLATIESVSSKVKFNLASFLNDLTDQKIASNISQVDQLDQVSISKSKYNFSLVLLSFQILENPRSIIDTLFDGLNEKLNRYFGLFLMGTDRSVTLLLETYKPILNPIM